jgi:hypothetical protein
MSLKCYITSKTLFDLCGRDFPTKTGYTYEDIEFPDDYEKPSKEAFEAKLKELMTVHYLKELRRERNRRLAEVDWVVIRATSTETPVPEEWKVYMQALRDLPSNTEDPANPVWPTAPSP